MVAQGTDDIEERITGFENREERACRLDRDLPFNETFPNNDANPSWLRDHSRSAAYPCRNFLRNTQLMFFIWKKGVFHIRSVSYLKFSLRRSFYFH